MELISHVARVVFSVNDHPSLPAVSIYFSGCDANPKCKGCHNQELWDVSAGKEVPIDALEDVVVKKLNVLLEQYPKVSLVYLGGEPLAIWHRDIVKELSKRIRERFGSKVVQLLYTWRVPLLIKRDFASYVENIDEFVTGRFIIELKNVDEDGNYLFPASTNQKYLKWSEIFTEGNKTN